ncbi:MAG: response regulator [Methylophilaceae bacterium]
MMSKLTQIMIVEDDADIGEFLIASLKAAGYQPQWKKNLTDAKTAFDSEKPALIILDLTLPDGDGRDFIADIRVHSDVPIIVLSARQSEQEKVACFTLGADDYLSKPFGVNELLARVMVALKRTTMMSLRDHIYSVDGLVIDSQNSTVSLSGMALHLTPLEFKLLFTLVKKPGKVFTHRQLLTEVWGAEYVDDTHYLRIHMGRLRAKIEIDPATPRFIITELGIGYRLAPN